MLMSFLGDTIPKYRDLLINSVLTGAYDSDGLVRASVIVTVYIECSCLFQVIPYLNTGIY